MLRTNKPHFLKGQIFTFSICGAAHHNYIPVLFCTSCHVAQADD
uniref:Uncharacterized protein n=1 Tax=Anguilla anguilla TaxID=7936 RepID=A0A0E9R2V5_ANGAN